MRPLLLAACIISFTIAGLYDECEEVQSLSTSNFSTEIFYSSKPHVVQFYSEWCGACVAYSQHFKKHLCDQLPDVQLSVVNCADDDNLPICRQNKIAAFPSIKFFAKESESCRDGIVYNGNKLNLNELQQFIENLYDSTEQESAALLPMAEEETIAELTKIEKKELVPVNISQFELHMMDIQSTEIPRREIIEGDNLLGLKQWIHALSKYGPGTIPMRQGYFLLDSWLKDKSQVTAYEWIAELDDIQEVLNQPLPSEVRWKACAGSQPYLRGFPCGVWTLTHALTAIAYDKEKDNPYFDAQTEIIEPFRQFITRFFSCRECAENFEKEIEKSQPINAQNKEEILLWLWNLHNIVNKRLSGSPSDDSFYPKRIFPVKEICPQCYDMNDNFDESQVFKFLRTYYSHIRE